MTAIPISEIFGPTVQGEGALIGKPTVFVRTGGCDFRCRWCDTLYAVLPTYRHDWSPMTSEEILGRVEQLTGGNPILVTVSGGNPPGGISRFSGVPSMNSVDGVRRKALRKPSYS